MPKFSAMRDELIQNNSAAIIMQNWSELSEQFKTMKKVAFSLLSVFGTSYLCESVFSTMKNTLSSIRNRMTESHSEACIRLQRTNYEADIVKLAKKKQN